MPLLQASGSENARSLSSCVVLLQQQPMCVFYLVDNMSKNWLQSEQIYREEEEEEEEDEPEQAAAAAAAQRACAAETVGFNAFYGHIYTGAVTELPHI